MTVPIDTNVLLSAALRDRLPELGVLPLAAYTRLRRRHKPAPR